MRRLARAYIAPIVCALTVASCSTVQTAAPAAAQEATRVCNEGYSILYQLLSQESGVATLLIIKHADTPIADIIKEIASTCSQAKTQLELFREKDPNLSLEMDNLPHIEQKTRAAIKSTDTKHLLFSSGKTFEVQLLFTQAEAMNYTAHLSSVLRDQEVNPWRKEYLIALSRRCTTLHHKAMGLLK